MALGYCLNSGLESILDLAIRYTTMDPEENKLNQFFIRTLVVNDDCPRFWKFTSQIAQTLADWGRKCSLIKHEDRYTNRSSGSAAHDDIIRNEFDCSIVLQRPTEHARSERIVVNDANAQ